MTARRLAAAASATIALVVLTGCQQPTPKVTVRSDRAVVTVDAERWCKDNKVPADGQCPQRAVNAPVLNVAPGTRVTVDGPLAEPHCGQAAGRPVPSTGSDRRPPGADSWGSGGSGGAAGLWHRAARPCSLIQSVVHAGVSTVRTSTAANSAPSAVRMSSSIMRMAGQPEYVGVITTVTCSPEESTSTARAMPRSTTLTTGISGSGTVSSTRQAAASRAGVVVGSAVTRSTPDRRGARTASRPAHAPGARCAGPACRRTGGADPPVDAVRRQAGPTHRAPGACAGRDAVLAPRLSGVDLVTADPTTTPAREAAAWRVLETVPDPEIPVVSVVDLGIARAVEVDPSGEQVTVVITPTYSGCPAMRMIEDDIRTALGAEFARVEVRTVLSPAWTTDWMSEQGRAALRAYGVAPPETPVAPAVAPAGRRSLPVLGTGRPAGATAGATGVSGGATPYARSAASPCSLIQSVVQAGLRTVRTSTRANSAPSAVRMSSSIMRMAGQPEYVGVITTVTCSPEESTSTARAMPRSTTLTTGISGSGTVSSTRQAAASRAGVVVGSAVTRSTPDRRGARTASRPAHAPGARCAGPACRRTASTGGSAPPVRRRRTPRRRDRATPAPARSPASPLHWRRSPRPPRRWRTARR